jgi:hypothetical protein
MGLYSANVPQHVLDAMSDAKRTPDRNGASEYGPGLSRSRADVAPLVDRRHRDGILRDPADLAPGALGHTTDVESRARIEDQLRRTEDELRR